jgi:hypothetical protein
MSHGGGGRNWLRGCIENRKAKTVLEFVETHPFDSAQGRLLPRRRGWKICHCVLRGKDGAPGPALRSKTEALES